MSDKPTRSGSGPRGDRPSRRPGSGKPSSGRGGSWGGKGGGKGGGPRGDKRGGSSGGSSGSSGGGRKPFNKRPSGGGGPRRGADAPIKLTNAQRARKAAAHAVGDVLGRGYRVESSLANNPALEGLEARDRAFARAIASNTLRRLGQVDAVLEPLLQRPPPGRVRAFLQTAVTQIVFMDVAPHAAVGDAVALVKADHKMAPFAGLCNAVLRKVSDTGKMAAAKTPPTANIPGWLRAEWSRLYGKAAVRRMALMLASPPPLDLSVKSDPEGWASRLGGAVIGEKTVRLDEIGRVSTLDGYDEGAWWAQDVAASLPARILEHVAGGLQGKTVADLCAAPGGKTMQMVAMGATVTAVDLSDARTNRLRQNIERTGLTADILTADLTEHEPTAQFDAVLLDAPCSATGTFRRHPDVIYNRRERDITPLTRLQDTLFKHAAKWVSPGGYLLYSVCSLQEREGAPRVRKFLKAMPEFSLVAVEDMTGLALPAERLDGGMMRILPPEAPDGRGMDGFFIAVVKKAAATHA